ncbi:hypothetical protein J2J97_32135 (plasmid) [Rhizobium bangladeshense]|uniref:hypothetical protein n=1 Tax=Rhizobium bangladeshense TaxID=1138189 RepID=UPI001A99B65B|nr:hypothetical protein [Rhizobium bangladeshense]QSY98556.1 hypothetical protein J2J97_32135 [Rhizobium bangladeshense]
MSTIYAWRSTLLKNYATGSLLAVAENADEAREKIRGHFDKWVKENREWFFLTDPMDDDDKEEVAKLKALLESDLAQEPATHDVIYVSGSE